MKKYLLLISLLAVCHLSHCQIYTFGFRGGLNQYKIGALYQPAYNGDPSIYNQPKKDIGYQYGAYLNVKFGKFFFQPELNFTTSKNHYDLPLKKSYWNTSKTEVPVLIGFELFKPVSIYIGPNFNFYKETTIDGVQITSYSNGGPDLEKTTLSLNFGIKATFGRFGLDLRYEIGQKQTQEELLDIIYSEYGTNLAYLKPYTPKILSLSVFIDMISKDGKQMDSVFTNLFKGDDCWCGK